jgi:hypothetical protein
MQNYKERERGRDHGGEAGLELIAVQEAVAVGVEAVEHLLDGRSQLY